MLCLVCCVLCVVCCAVLCCVVSCVLCLVRPSVVVVLRPSSVPSVRRRRPSSSSSVRPSRPSVAVVRPSSSSCESKAACEFSKEKRRNRGREYEIRIELEIWKSIAGGKLLCVLKKLVLRPKHFCFRILVLGPNVDINFLDIIYNDDKIMIILIK